MKTSKHMKAKKITTMLDIIVKSKITLTTMCIAVIILSLGCAMDVPEKGYDYLTPPFITGIYQDGDHIVVTYIGYNDEYYFDGYNVYVSPTSLNKSLIESYKPVQVAETGYASSEPSYPLSPDDFDPSQTRTLTLDRYYVQNGDQYEQYPFSSGTYYVLLCSHHRLGFVLPESVSNQVSIDFQ
jgi:hypothetical protein